MATMSVYPEGSTQNALEQLHGRRTRLQRELSQIRGVDQIAIDRRARLLRDIEQATLKIRELASDRLGAKSRT